MSDQLIYKSSGCINDDLLPGGFIAVCVLAFFVGILATAYYCRSMCCEMEMPGGWTMSMMWVQIHGRIWFSAINFLLMWLAMMVAMMMPSALPVFIKSSRQFFCLCYMASGYFFIWLAAGVMVYVLGVGFATVVMRSELFSHSIPLLSSLSLIVAGLIQFTPWKLACLLCCRSPYGCVVLCSQNESGFWLGCKQGAECFLCCIAPMIVQFALGIMNPLVMIAITVVIAAERFLPRPEIVTKLVGIFTIIAGIVALGEFLLGSGMHGSICHAFHSQSSVCLF